MRRRIASASALAVALLLPVALTRAADAPKGDKDLDGDWEVVSMVRDGKDMPPPDNQKAVLSVHGDAVTFKAGDESHKGTIKVDAGKTPKTFDMTPDDGPNKGKAVMGLYEVKGDELKVCHGEPGSDRPKEIGSKEGSGLTLVTLKRVKK